LTKTFKASRVRIKTGEDRKQIVTFTSKDPGITRKDLEVAVKAPKGSGKMYLVWSVKKEEKKEEEKKKGKFPPDVWPDGTMHLLLLEYPLVRV
tara:strand:- start:122 stop:400 length:279 start_codon:yes stop_codon:yes gene_type:complete